MASAATTTWAHDTDGVEAPLLASLSAPPEPVPGHEEKRSCLDSTGGDCEKGIAFQQRVALALISAGIFSALSIWFSASAVLAALTKTWNITGAEGSFLTSMVNVGFCVGCLISAVSGLADALAPTLLILIGSLGAAVANLGLLLVDSFAGALLARALVGFFLSLVYPPGVKLLSTWFAAQHRGNAIGIMFGAFCLGSAFPQLLTGAAAHHSWKPVVVITSSASAASGLLVYWLVEMGPFRLPASAPVFQCGKCIAVLRNPHVGLAILAYCGHMWELFCVWAWLATFMEESWQLSASATPFVACAVISMGGPGSWIGGALGDRWGHVRVAGASLAVSGSCIAVLGWMAHEGPLAIRIGVFIVWGLTAIADSPAFSAIISIYADQQHVGTAVTVQLLCGYLVTVLALWIVPHLATSISWRWSFFSLAAGPLVGLAAMLCMGRKFASEAKDSAPDRAGTQHEGQLVSSKARPGAHSPLPAPIGASVAATAAPGPGPNGEGLQEHRGLDLEQPRERGEPRKQSRLPVPLALGCRSLL